MSKINEHTGDRLINNKGDQEKYRENWDRIFGKSSDTIEKIREKNMERYKEAYKKMAEDD